MNVEIGTLAVQIPRKGIHKWIFLCSAATMHPLTKAKLLLVIYLMLNANINLEKESKRYLCMRVTCLKGQ
jgi:hypothetical protein